MSMRTLEEIKQDFQSYKALAKKQKGVTLYAEKYVEDVGSLLNMLNDDTTTGVFTSAAADPVAPTRREKAKAPKAE